MEKMGTRLLKWLDGRYSLLTKLVAGFAGLLALFTTAVLLIDMSARNLLGVVNPWYNEITLVLIMWIFMLPIAYSQMSEGMIRITFFTDKLPLKAQPWLRLFGSLAAVIFGLLFLLASLGYLAMAKTGSYYPTTHFPTTVQRGLISGCVALLTIAAIICLGRDILALRRQNLTENSSEASKKEDT